MPLLSQQEESDIKRIAELVKKLDTDQVGRVSEIKVFPLKFARAADMVTILNTILNTRPQSFERRQSKPAVAAPIHTHAQTKERSLSLRL